MANTISMKLLCLIVLVAGVVAVQSAPLRKDIPTIARSARGAIVSIVMSDKDGHPIAQGSGFLISKDGRVVTNYHVVKQGSSAVVKFPDGAFFVVDGVVAFDKSRDVAVIKAHGENFRTLTLGDSDKIQVGEEVVAIGNPLSLESTVSNGIVSGIRTIGDDGGKFLQITAPISHGSSGGPLFNMAGEVIGITSSGLPGGENLNFAIPINDAKPLLSTQFAKIHNFPDEPEPNTEATADAGDGGSLSLKDTLDWMSNFARFVPWHTTCIGTTLKAFPCTHEYLSVSADACTITAKVVRLWVDDRTGKLINDLNITAVYTIPLKEIDPEQIRVTEEPETAWADNSKQVETSRYNVEFYIADASPKIGIDSITPKYGPLLTNKEFLVFPEEDDAKRFAAASKHAVQLCGGKHLF